MAKVAKTDKQTATTDDCADILDYDDSGLFRCPSVLVRIYLNMYYRSKNLIKLHYFLFLDEIKLVCCHKKINFFLKYHTLM